ncbi:MAG: penicillin acylase family protein, partial [Proteobacteria bacterium]|nr:penicillin acylase family protein [Pseudomonadota bacterium]
HVQETFSHIPILASTLKPREKVTGSNEWAVSGQYTDSGNPLVANDPHLALGTPATFHESNLVYNIGDDSYAVSGVQFPGAPASSRVATTGSAGAVQYTRWTSQTYSRTRSC